MRDVKPVLALPEGFQFVGFEKRNDVLTVTLVSTQVSPCCPLCGSAARRVHSCYTRRVADLPCGGQSLRLLIGVRKYFCEESSCPRKIFAERLAPLVDPFARVTKRLCQIVQIIGLATGGRLGVRVTDRLGIQTSRQTILRRIMDLPTEPAGQVPQIGIDDFSFRRGHPFGTIIVNLQTHKMLEVLPERTAETATAWLASHPEIELVSRDRGGDYASAAAAGAPQAVQCADRCRSLPKCCAHAPGKTLMPGWPKPLPVRSPNGSRFVLGIERGYWRRCKRASRGPKGMGSEIGKVNKLKLIKRMGYGRAGFPLLRQRVLHAL